MYCESFAVRLSIARLGTDLALQAIECSDTDLDALADVSDETLIDYYREMGDIAISGQGWAYWIAACRRWKSRASEVYRGPWTLADGLKKPKYVRICSISFRSILITRYPPQLPDPLRLKHSRPCDPSRRWSSHVRRLRG